MKKMMICLLALLFMFPVAGCQSDSGREQMGTIMGGALGGILGSTVGSGHGKTAAIIAGTLGGAVLGREMARYMDKNDEAKSQSALENNRDRQSSSWTNPNTGAQFTTTPVSTYQDSYGRNCREYQTDIYVDGRQEVGHGTACRQPDGTWRMVQ